jgi:hypothetical protein
MRYITDLLHETSLLLKKKALGEPPLNSETSTDVWGSLVDKGICLINLYEMEDKPQRLQGPVMSMYFYDDTDDWPEYKIIKDYIHRLEMARLEFGKELEEAEAAFILDPANENLKDQVDEFKKKLKEIEKRLSESLSMYR